MTSQIPAQPAPFAPLPGAWNVMPNPRTVRAQDITWFNTRGGQIIKTSYNKCNSQMSTQAQNWNRPVVLQNRPFWTQPVPTFDLYGLSSSCEQELNRCQCDGCKKSNCFLYQRRHQQA